MPCRFCHRLFRCFVEWLVARNAYWIGSPPFTHLLEIFLFISATPLSKERPIPYLIKLIIYPRSLNSFNLLVTIFGFSTRSEEHTSELQSLMRISYAVFCLKKKTKPIYTHIIINQHQCTLISQTKKNYCKSLNHNT